MFVVAICDDEVILCTQIEKVFETYIENKSIRVDVFYSGEQLYKMMSSGQHYDLIFLDIEFRRMSGLDVGKKIRDELKNDKTHIVYISAKKEYALELFKIRPMNFLIKPISDGDIIENLNKAIKLSDMYDELFEYRIGSEYFRIPYGDIVYFESSNRKIRVHTKCGMEEIYGKLDDIEKEASLSYIRIHKSYLVNSMYITYWKADEIHLKNEIKLPISQSYRRKVGKILLK